MGGCLSPFDQFFFSLCPPFFATPPLPLTQATHFVLELLQNADDASYAPGVQPRVLLVVMPDAILHATNETGFTAANVEAICAMGRSTKSRKVGAFTGEKG